MKVKEYLEALNKLVNDNPGALELDLITSIDDEGNGYNLVFFGPSLAEYDPVEREIVVVYTEDNEEPLPVTMGNATAVCLN